jgi:hypothetical protein
LFQQLHQYSYSVTVIGVGLFILKRGLDVFTIVDEMFKVPNPVCCPD